jgi:hypothetical protein
MMRHARATGTVGLVLLVGYFCFTGWWGIDFGTHWDEWYHIAGLTKCINKMQLVPQDFIYNGMYFLLGLPLLAAHLGHDVPPILRELKERTPTLSLDASSLNSVKKLQSDASTLLATKDYLLETRTLFLCVSALGIVWVYLTILRLYPRRYLAALAGAAFLALSWEFQYHARIVAIDAPLAQFLALELLLLCCAWRAESRARFAGWMVAAAVAGGIVFGCKMTGIFALVPLVGLPLLRRTTWRSRLAIAALSVVVFFATTGLVSPAMFLDPLHAFETMRYVKWDYDQQADASRNYYVDGRGEHVGRLFTWFIAAVPAPSLWRALPLAAVAVLGLAVLFRRHRGLIAVWCLFAAITIAVLSKGHLLIVRQYVMFVPFMAIAFGAGVAFLRFHVRRPRVRGLLTAALVVALVLNGRWLFAASRSIRTTTADTIKAELVADLLRDRRPISLTGTVHTLVASEISAVYRCEPTKPDEQLQRSIVMRYGDGAGIKANRPYALERVYSSHEVNYDWYSSWLGNHSGERILRLPSRSLAGLRVSLVGTFNCVPR